MIAASFRRVFTLAALSASLASAQPNGGSASRDSVPTPAFGHVLTPPRGELRCTSLGPDTARETISYKFEAGHDVYGDSRTIQVRYDSAGNVRSLREMANARNDKQGTTTDLLLAVFGARASMGMHTHYVQHPDRARGDTAFVRRPLTAAQMAQARDLGAWLWQRRCK